MKNIILKHFYHIKDFLKYGNRLNFIDPTVKLKQKAIQCIINNICPFCEVNNDIHNTIQVGYTYYSKSFKYSVFWIEVGDKKSETYINIPICRNCTNRIDNLEIMNPSKIVCSEKSGYEIGLLNPFEFNIKVADKEWVDKTISYFSYLNEIDKSSINKNKSDFFLEKSKDGISLEETTRLWEKEQLKNQSFSNYQTTTHYQNKIDFLKKRYLDGVLFKNAMKQWEGLSKPVAESRMEESPKIAEQIFQNKLPSQKARFTNSRLLLFLLISAFLAIGFIFYRYLNDDLHLSFGSIKIGYNSYVVKVFSNESNNYYIIRYKFKNTENNEVTKEQKALGGGFNQFMITGYDLQVTAKSERGNKITLEVWKNDKLVFKDEIQRESSVEVRDL